MTSRPLIARIMQTYWRWSRGLTVGAQGCILDADNRVLLIRHTYRPGWHFPGGGAEKGEAIADAMAREVYEETGVLCSGRPQLFALYANHERFPGDHIAVFVVRDWQQPNIPPPNREIAEQKFFAVDALPDTIHAPTRRRIDEILNARAPDLTW